MSRRLGKLICEKEFGAGSVAGAGSAFSSCSVKYVPHTDKFWFRFKGKGLCGWKNGHTIKIDADLVLDIVSISVSSGSFSFLYEWSVGYVVRPLVSDWNVLRTRELDWLGGRKELIMSGKLDYDTDFDEFCCLCYLFCIGTWFLTGIRNRKRKIPGNWISVSARS